MGGLHKIGTVSKIFLSSAPEPEEGLQAGKHERKTGGGTLLHRPENHKRNTRSRSSIGTRRAKYHGGRNVAE